MSVTLSSNPTVPAPERAHESRWLQRAIEDDYRLVRVLGRGGTGAVYLALDRKLQRWVAIKTLLPELAGDEGNRQKFRREALANARLTHPNIVPIHAFVESNDVVCSVMTYIRGPSLAHVLWRREPLPARAACRILAELASALAYAHRERIVHRDIKPENVLLDHETGRPMLTDFGIARSVSLDAMQASEILAERGVIRGTAHFMSPEQAAGDPDLDGRSDIYSLGVLGYALLSGRLPFEGRNLMEVLAAHGTILPPSLAEQAPDVPAGVVRTITRCLAKAPEDRWPDGDALADALRREGISLSRFRSPFARLAERLIRRG